MKKKIPALLAVVALAGGGALLLNTKSQRHAHETGPIMLPVVVEARVLSVGHTRLTLPVVADVQALRDSVVSSRLLAYVTALPLFEGARFKRGELLARLDTLPAGQGQGQGNSLQADLAAAESNLKTEQERLHRAKALYEIQGVSLEQVQAAAAAFAGARSRHALARENLRGATITAPFAGVVSQRLAQPGDLMTPGKPMLKITDTSAGNRLLVNVPEDMQPAGLLVGDELLPLKPWPEAGPQGLRRYEARSQDAALLPGARIDAKLLVFRSPVAVRLPRACLLNDDGRSATVLALKGAVAPAMAPPAGGHQPQADETKHHAPGAAPAGAASQHPAAQHQAAQHPAVQHAAPQPPTETHPAAVHPAAQHAAAEPAAQHAAAPAAGGHHRKPPSAGTVEAIRVVLAAVGQEGAVAADANLAGRRVVCGSPDVLARIVAGAPFTLQAGEE